MSRPREGLRSNRSSSDAGSHAASRNQQTNSAEWAPIFFIACLVLNFVLGRFPTAGRPFVDCLRRLQSVQPWEEVSLPTRLAAGQKPCRASSEQAKTPDAAQETSLLLELGGCVFDPRNLCIALTKPIIFDRDGEGVVILHATTGSVVVPAMVEQRLASAMHLARSSVATQQEISFRARFERGAPATFFGQRDPKISADCARELL